jgi:hypothetical protein
MLPYQDQIWIKSNCREFEKNTNSVFDQFQNKQIHIRLVDTVDHNYKNYKVVVTDNIISDFEYLRLWPEYWGSFSYTPEYKNNIPTRLFNCFINRTDLIRQSWFYQLVRRKLIDQGAVSFLLDYRKSAAPSMIDVDDKATLYQWVFEQGCEIFVNEHELMRSKVPFQNFSGDLDQVMCDSRVGLIIETYFDRPDIIAFSEKVFRALQLPRPFLLYCAPGAIKVLRDQGFDVYDDIVNHSYDLDVDNIKRQIKILDELEKSKYIVYNEQVLEDFEQKATHNRSLLIKLKNDWPAKLEKVMSEVVRYK